MNVQLPVKDEGLMQVRAFCLALAVQQEAGPCSDPHAVLLTAHLFEEYVSQGKIPPKSAVK